MARFGDFVRGMAEVQNKTRLGEGDFPPLSSSKPGSSSTQKGKQASTSTSFERDQEASPMSGSAQGKASASSKGGDQAEVVSDEVQGENPQAATAPCASWSSLFTTNKAATLKYHQPSVEDGKSSVFISKLVHSLGFSAWEDCLVGQFLGFTPPLAQIQAVLRQLWGRWDRVDIMRL